MLRHYQETRRAFIQQRDIGGIGELGPTPKLNKDIDVLCDKLKSLDTVTKALQSDTVMIAEMQALFDSFIGEFACTNDRSLHSTELVECPHFDSAVVNIQNQQHMDLTQAERLTAGPLRTTEISTTPCSATKEPSHYDRPLQRSRSEQLELRIYLDLRFLMRISNFSECSRRQGTT